MLNGIERQTEGVNWQKYQEPEVPIQTTEEEHIQLDGECH